LPFYICSVTDESLVNVVHYFGLFAVGCIFHGVDFQSMLVSISALFLGIGFIIGGACANFLEVGPSLAPPTNGGMNTNLIIVVFVFATRDS